MSTSSNPVAKALTTIGIAVMILGGLGGLLLGAQVSGGLAIALALSAVVGGIPFFAFAEIIHLLQIGTEEKQQCNYKLDQLIALQKAAPAAQQTPDEQPSDSPEQTDRLQAFLQTLRLLPSGKEIRAALEANQPLFEENAYQAAIAEVDRLLDLGRLYGDMKKDILAYLTKTFSTNS